jgi:hypothetical protein
MMSATSLPIAFNPCCEHSCHNMHLTADLGLVSGCEDLDPSAQTVAVVEGLALANGLDARLHPVGDLQGALVIGRRYSGWDSIENRAEMFVGLRDAPLFQQ